METGKAIYKLLKDSADVGAICADRIYPELAQQDVDVPFIVYTVTDTTPSATKNATSKLDTARVELYCVSDDYEQSMDLGIACRTALDRQSGTVSGVEVQSIDFDTSDVQFDPDQRVYVLEQTYDVRIQRTGTAVSVANFPSNTFTVEEADGSPSGAVNKLVFSNGSLSIDGTTGTVTSGGGTSYYTLKSYFANSAGSSTYAYIPFSGNTDSTALQYRHQFLCPFNGSLKRVYIWRQSGSNMTSGTITFDFHRLTGVASSSSLEDQVLNAPVNAGASYNVSFSSSSVSAGFVYAMIVRNDTDQNLGNVVVSLVFEVTSIA
jgi:hypothetical protein